MRVPRPIARNWRLLRPPRNSFDVILQVSNDAYAVGGMWEPIIFGTYEQVDRFSRAFSFLGYFFFGSLSAICIFFLIFFLAQKSEKEALILAGIGMMVILRLMIYGDTSITYLFPNMPIFGFGWIDYLTLLWIQFLLSYFIYSSYADLIPRGYVIALLVYSAGISLFVILAPFGVVARRLPDHEFHPAVRDRGGGGASGPRGT